MSFRFDQASPSSRHVIITVATAFLQAQDSGNKRDWKKPKFVEFIEQEINFHS